MYISCFASSNLTNSQFLAKDTNLLCPLGFTNVSFPAWNKSTSAFIFCIFSSFKSSLIPLNAWFTQLKDQPAVCHSLCSNCLLKYVSYLFRELVAELIKSGLLLNGPCPNKYLLPIPIVQNNFDTIFETILGYFPVSISIIGQFNIAFSK